MAAPPLARPPLPRAPLRPAPSVRLAPRGRLRATAASGGGAAGSVLRTCKNCKQQYDPTANHPSACRYHTAHFGGNHLKYTSNLRPNMLNWLRWDVKKDTI